MKKENITLKRIVELIKSIPEYDLDYTINNTAFYRRKTSGQFRDELLKEIKKRFK